MPCIDFCGWGHAIFIIAWRASLENENEEKNDIYDGHEPNYSEPIAPTYILQTANCQREPRYANHEQQYEVSNQTRFQQRI